MSERGESLSERVCPKEFVRKSLSERVCPKEARVCPKEFVRKRREFVRKSLSERGESMCKSFKQLLGRLRPAYVLIHGAQVHIIH
jgi:hypothetical protein